jgi:hypothetical protein
MPGMLNDLKRWTLRVHLYLGAALCALFVVWFLSGVVMMYQGYPGLTAGERLASLPALDCRRCTVTPAEAVRLAGLPGGEHPLRLGMWRSRPVWRVANAEGRWYAIHADSSAPLEPLTPAASASLALAFAGPDARAARYHATLTDADQWTLTRTVRNQMPLHRIDVLDRVGTRVYVSPRSAEVVSASTQRERLLTWFGAIPHWIYPTILRRHAEAWSWLVIVVSGLGTIMSLAGLAIGIWQFRWRRHLRRDGAPAPSSPYREFVMRWHHLLGLGFGVFVCTWVFSGLMSMNPGRWSPGSGPTPTQRLAWSGGPVMLDSLNVPPSRAWSAFREAGWTPREMRIVRLGGTHFWVGEETPHRTARVPADARADGVMSTGALPLDTLWEMAALVARARTVIPTAPLVNAQLLTDYDHYYRDRAGERPLPVLRVIFGDADRTWLYLDPRSGEIAQRREWRGRLERWLYSGLHDLDFGWLASRRPLWDVVMIFLSAGGVLLSVTGVVLSWRYARALSTGQRDLRRR